MSIIFIFIIASKDLRPESGSAADAKRPWLEEHMCLGETTRLFDLFIVSYSFYLLPYIYFSAYSTATAINVRTSLARMKKLNEDKA
jgi:hypothetical protein